MACSAVDGVIVQAISEAKGRGLFATRDFVKGETIFKEKPIASVQFSWNVECKYRACHHCLEPLETANENAVRLANDPNIVLPYHEACASRSSFHVKCPNCDVVYCSASCQEESWNSYHKVLCHVDPKHPLKVLDEMWRNIHYPPETTSIMLVCRILASIVQSSDPDRKIADYLQMIHETNNVKEGLVHKLLGDEYASQIEQLRLATVNAFASYPVVQRFLDNPEGFATLLALIGRNSQGIGTSAFAVWAKKAEKLATNQDDRSKLDTLINSVYDAFEQHVGGGFLNNEGSGLFSLQSTINHSCDPNASVEFPFNNHELVVNATKSIQVGEEILISYLDCCDLERSRHSRHKALRENYLFSCDCNKCLEQINDPDITSEEDMSEEEERGGDSD